MNYRGVAIIVSFMDCNFLIVLTTFTLKILISLKLLKRYRADDEDDGEEDEDEGPAPRIEEVDDDAPVGIVKKGKKK